MSVENFNQLGGALAYLGEDTPENCFFCGRPLEGVTTCWHGVGAEIALHPDCAERLAIHLIKDSFNAKRLAEGKPVNVGIGVGLDIANSAR